MLDLPLGCVMTRRVPCPAAPGPLEEYAARFDDLFGVLAQRRGFREYLTGLLAPRGRNKTLTALAGQEFADPDEIAHATRVATAQLNARARPWIWGRPEPKHRSYRRRFIYTL